MGSASDNDPGPYCCYCGEGLLWDDEQEVEFVCGACGQRFLHQPEEHPHTQALQFLGTLDEYGMPDWYHRNGSRLHESGSGAKFAAAFCRHILSGLAIEEAQRRALRDV